MNHLESSYLDLCNYIYEYTERSKLWKHHTWEMCLEILLSMSFNTAPCQVIAHTRNSHSRQKLHSRIRLQRDCVHHPSVNFVSVVSVDDVFYGVLHWLDFAS